MMNLGRVMKYQPELNKITGSITATILMGQLEYWFDRLEGKPFYKFLAPCEDECYKEGDSWCEELCFSKVEFRNAFKRIGKVYKSKKDYLNSKDPFAGKLYLSYYDRIRRRTYYLRNHDLVNQTFENVLGSSSTNTQSHTPLTEDYSIDLHTQITTEDESKEMDTHQQVINLYHELCPDLKQVDKLTSSRRRMIDALLNTLGGSLSKIRTLFEKTKASDFLSGRLPNNKWQALFDWIITSSNSLAILEGKYDNWQSPFQKASSQSMSKESIYRGRNNFTTTYSHNWDFDKLDELAYNYFLSRLA